MDAGREAVVTAGVSRTDDGSVQRVDRSILNFYHWLRRDSNPEVLAVTAMGGSTPPSHSDEKPTRTFEHVYTVIDYWDDPHSGVANFKRLNRMKTIMSRRLTSGNGPVAIPG